MTVSTGFDKLPQEIKDIFFEEYAKAGIHDLVHVSKEWKQSVERYTENIVIPQLKYLDKFLWQAEPSFDGLGLRVVKKIRFLAAVSVQQYEIGNLDNRKFIGDVFRNYQKIYDLLPFLSDYFYHKWSVIKLSESYDNQIHPLPKVLQDIPEYVQKVITPELVLKEFSKIGLVSSPRKTFSSRKPIHPEKIMSEDLLYMQTATFRNGKSFDSSIAYVYGGGISPIIALLKQEALKKFKTLSELYEEAFEERAIRFGMILGGKQLTPFEDQFEFIEDIHKAYANSINIEIN